MRLLRMLTWAWVLGILVARLCEAAPLLSLSAGCALAITGLLLVRSGAPRLGLLLSTGAVAWWVALPVAGNTPALHDGTAWDLLARADGVQRRDGERISLPVELEHARRDGVFLRVSGRYRLSVPALREPVAPADLLLLRARASPPGRTCNPGDCEGSWRAAAQGIDGSLHVARSELVLRIDAPPSGLRARLWRLRLALQAAIIARLPAAEASLVAALVLGERGGLDDATEARFRCVGITHLLSVSGLHLAFAAGLLFALLRRLLAWAAPGLGRTRPRDRLAALVAAPLVVCYALLTGAEVATLRAALVVTYAFGALVLSRRLRGPDALAFAALSLLLPGPARLFDVSFQLSFVAALATLLGVARVAPRPPAPGVVGALRRLGHLAGQLVRVSFAATLATAPLTAAWFSEVAPMGVLSNVVAVPLSEMLLVPLGIVGASLDTLAPPLGVLPLHLAGFCAWLLLSLARVLAPVSPVFEVAAPSLLCMAVCAAALFYLSRGPGWRRLLVAIFLVAGVQAGEGLVARLWPTLEVCFLDVGQGDGAVVLLPDGVALVIDGGPDPDGRALLGFLRRRGVRRVALMVLSHPHPDHAGGLAAVVAALPVEALWLNGQQNADPATRALLELAGRRGVPIGAPTSLQHGGVSLTAIGPRDVDGALRADPLQSENDNSLVLTLAYAGRRVLFAGDVEAAGEQALLRSAVGRHDILKVPHHASRTSSSTALLDAATPSWAVASLAQGNRYHFPHPDVVRRYRSRGVTLYRTDRDGAVTLRIGPRGAVSFSCARATGCHAE